LQITKLTLAAAAAFLLAAAAAQADDLAPAPKGVTVAASAAAAAAKPGDPAAAATALGKLPIGGYSVASSGGLTAPPGAQSHGQASCPPGTVPLGGGAAINSSSTAAGLNSSYPTLGGWAADVNNGSGSATYFTVYAVCAGQPRGYELIDGAYAATLAGEQSSPTASCSNALRQPLGGGAYADSASLLVNINSTLPTADGWRVDLGNGSVTTMHVQTRVICGKLANVHVVTSGKISGAAGLQTGGTATCDTGLPVGGGVLSDSGSTLVDVNSSYPVIGGWKAFVNDGTAYAQPFTVYAVCAGW
jgi:hypothetical protein